MERLEERSLLAADFDLIGEFVAAPQERGSNPGLIAELDGSLIFTTPKASWNLWSSDGTDPGTIELVNFQVPFLGFISGVQDHVIMSGTLYLLLTTLTFGPDIGLESGSIEGWELWKSDGTTAGTSRVHATAMHDYATGVVRDLTALNGQLYFVAQGQIWTSDGTSTGTNPLSLGAASLGIQSVSELTEVDGKLLFVGKGSSSASSGLWMYDTAVRESYLLATEPNGSLNPENLTRVGSSIFFTARYFNSGRELWRSDGTAAGTYLVKDINPGGSNSYSRLLTNVSGTLFFSANDGVSGGELWKSDGTEAGTVRVKDIQTGRAGSYLHGMINVGGILYFSANDGVSGGELWKSDGSEAGTVRIEDIFPGAEGSTPFHLTNVNGIAYFSAKKDATGRELWRSDGTGAGTYMVRDILPGSKGSYPDQMMNVGGRLFFSATGRIADRELWVSDGTLDGTQLVKDLHDFDLTRPRRELFEFDGALFFSARLNPNSQFDYELWKSNGTVDGTALLKEFNPGFFGSTPTEFTILGGALYFQVFVGDHSAAGVKKYQLWRTDGTAEGLIVLHTGLPTLAELTLVGDAIYFVGGGAAAPGALWKSDGTTAGTVQLKDIRAGKRISYPRLLTNVAGRLFFAANDGSTGEELWVSDGTEAGTQLVKDIVAGANGAALGNLTEMGGAVYFTANDGASGVELWKSDGTAAGTIRVKDIATGAGSSTPSHLLNVGGTLYFTANDGVAGEEFWRSDGTEAGTVRVRDIRPGSVGSTPTQLIDVAGTLYFAANDGVAGIELWTSDGTEHGTRLVADLRPGAGDAKPVNLTNIDGQLYFHANDGTQGVELWSSDGTATGTKLIADFDAAAGVGLSSLGGRLVVLTLNDEFNEQMWIATAPGTPLRGDYDANGVVDGADFLAWQRGFSGAATPAGSGADGDGSGTVDAGDLAVWAEHFGEGSANGVGAAAAMMADSLAAAAVVASDGDAEALLDVGVSAMEREAFTTPAMATSGWAGLAQRANRSEGVPVNRGVDRASLKWERRTEVSAARRDAAGTRDAAFAGLDAAWLLGRRQPAGGFERFGGEWDPRLGGAGDELQPGDGGEAFAWLKRRAEEDGGLR